MKKFLYEDFPTNYARIYKAFLQHRGRQLIPQAIGKLSDGEKLDKMIEAEAEVSGHDVFLALHSMNYLEKNGYAHVLYPLSETRAAQVLTDPLETVLLQMVRSERWQKGYKTDEEQKQYDLILAIPEWSRVVAVSTTEIEPTMLVSRLQQFDTLWLRNFHFYEFFNRLHGVAGRAVELEAKDDYQRVANFGKLNFLFRTCADAKKLSKCKNMQFFTLVPDINGKLRVGFYFALVCKIIDIKDTLRKDGSGIDPYNFRLVVSDDSGPLDMLINTQSFVNSIRKKHLENEFNGFLGSKTRISKEFSHPYELKAHDGYLLAICNWFLGDDVPNFSFGSLLGSGINSIKFYMTGYMNTRKKISYARIKEKWGAQFKHVSETSPNLKIDHSETWGYYKEDAWDEEMFGAIVKKKFITPPFHERLKLGISIPQLNEWRKITGIYFTINDYAKRLYTTEDPENEFNDVYAEIAPHSLNPNVAFVKADDVWRSSTNWYDLWQIPNLVPVKDWSIIKIWANRLKEVKCNVSIIFKLGNGGQRLENRWQNFRSRKMSDDDEILSALSYIFQARGVVILPEEIR